MAGIASGDLGTEPPGSAMTDWRVEYLFAGEGLIIAGNALGLERTYTRDDLGVTIALPTVDEAFTGFEPEGTQNRPSGRVTSWRGSRLNTTQSRCSGSARLCARSVTKRQPVDEEKKVSDPQRSRWSVRLVCNGAVCSRLAGRSRRRARIWLSQVVRSDRLTGRGPDA